MEVGLSSPRYSGKILMEQSSSFWSFGYGQGNDNGRIELKEKKRPIIRFFIKMILSEANGDIQHLHYIIMMIPFF